jgi:hypothetical protein
MMVGDITTLRLVDRAGNVISGAFWSTDDNSVLTLSTDDPPQITAIGTGTAHVTASANGLSSNQSTITVVPYASGHHFAAGTVPWTTPTTNYINQVMQNGNGLIGVENVPAISFSSVVLRGLGLDGQQQWQSPAIPYSLY